MKPSTPNSPTFLQNQPSVGDQETISYPGSFNPPNNKSYDVSDLHMGSLWRSDSPVKWQIARLLRIKSSRSSLYGLQVEVELRKENTMRLEKKWMDQEECEDMDGFADAFVAFTENQRKMCRE